MDDTLNVIEPPEKKRKTSISEEPEIVDRFCDPDKPQAITFQVCNYFELKNCKSKCNFAY